VFTGHSGIDAARPSLGRLRQPEVGQTPAHLLAPIDSWKQDHNDSDYRTAIETAH
jgi:hypothetical protein